MSSNNTSPTAPASELPNSVNTSDAPAGSAPYPTSNQQTPPYPTSDSQPSSAPPTLPYPTSETQPSTAPPALPYPTSNAPAGSAPPTLPYPTSNDPAYPPAGPPVGQPTPGTQTTPPGESTPIMPGQDGLKQPELPAYSAPPPSYTDTFPETQPQQPTLYPPSGVQAQYIPPRKIVVHIIFIILSRPKQALSSSEYWMKNPLKFKLKDM